MAQGGLEYRRKYHKREWLVRSGRASFWHPYRPLSEIDLDKVFGDVGTERP